MLLRASAKPVSAVCDPPPNSSIADRWNSRCQERVEQAIHVHVVVVDVQGGSQVTVLLADDDACSRSLSTVASAWRPRSIDTMPAVLSRPQHKVRRCSVAYRAPSLSLRQTHRSRPHRFHHRSECSGGDHPACTDLPPDSFFFFQERPASCTTSGSMNRVHTWLAGLSHANRFHPNSVAKRRVLAPIGPVTHRCCT